MARHRTPAEEEESDQGEETVGLQFDEPLSWRAGKPIATGELHNRLNRLSKELTDMDQEKTDKDSLVKVAKELASHSLLHHKDQGVKAFAACCLVDILRICAPDAPFTPNQLKDIFTLFIMHVLPALQDPSNTYNTQHKYVLQSLAEVKSILLLQDIDNFENLMLRLLTSFFDGVSGSSKSTTGEQVAKDVEFNMTDIIVTLVDEAESLPGSAIDTIMAQFLRAATPGSGKERSEQASVDGNQSTLLLKDEPEAYLMAKTICTSCPEKMARYVSQYFSDVIMEVSRVGSRSNGQKGAVDSDDEDGLAGPSESDLKELRKAHLLLRELWRAAPTVLQNVVPQVDAELSADNVHLRQLATETLGDMISGIGAAGPPPPPTLDPAGYPPLRLGDETPDHASISILTTPLSHLSFAITHPTAYQNFVNRKNDKSAAIRSAWTIAAGHILSTSAGGVGLSREDEAILVKGLGEKLSDSDEKVRLAAVKAIESFSFRNIINKLAPTGGVDKEGSILSVLADRCRDKRQPVRVEAMALLAKLWAVASGELAAGQEIVTAALSGIPSRIINVFYANDTELNVLLDRVMFECLVPLTYPPPKAKGQRSANGGSQSQGAAVIDHDKIRAERILLLVQSLDPQAKKAFLAMQTRQPQFAKILETFLKQCEAYNGGVMDDNTDRKTTNLEKTIHYITQFLPDPAKVKADLYKFAKTNDRRNYQLIKFAISQENDFKTVYRAIKELVKRTQSGSSSSLFETLISLLYRSAYLMFNRSHLSTIMDYSKSNEGGFGGTAHEILNEISQKNPDLFKAHIGELCKDLIEQAPAENKPNEAILVETLKACSSYSRKYPDEVPVDRKFMQALINFALYGRPPKAAKYAVNIIMSKKDKAGINHATNLLSKTMKDWSYGSPFFLNKLATVSQLELLAPAVMEDSDDEISAMAFKNILRDCRSEATDRDPNWVDDADMDEECQAKCLALKILVNRLRSMDVEDAKEKCTVIFSLLTKLIDKGGEICKVKDTPEHHKSRLRLLAAQLLLKLCTQKHFDDKLSAADFNRLAYVTQDAVQQVRHRFVEKLQKYLVRGRLRSRFYTIVFLTAFEPATEFKQHVETWARSRARHFQNAAQPVMEAIMARLLSVLAHHPDYSPGIDDLADHARYILYYVSNVATESNLGMIYRYAERVKQTLDAIDESKSENLHVLSDLAQAVIRKWQERKGWSFQAYGGKVGLPMGLYLSLPSHDKAQEIAEKQFLPEGVDDKLDEMLRTLDRKKKRKFVDDRGDSRPQAKKVKAPPRPSAKPTKPSSRKERSAPKPKKTPAKPKRTGASSPAISSAERRRSGRARGSRSYIERDSSEDDEEMLDGVAEWDYMNEDGDDDDDEGVDKAPEASGESEADDAPERDKPESDKNDGDVEEAEEAVEEVAQEQEEDSEEEVLTPPPPSPPPPPPPKQNGRKAKTPASAAPKSTGKPKRAVKASPNPTTRATRGRTRAATKDVQEVGEEE